MRFDRIASQTVDKIHGICCGFSIFTRLKVSIYRTLKPFFDIIEVSKKTGGIHFYDDSRKRKS